MHPRATEFAELAADRYGFTPEVEEFPEGTKTAADAAAAVGCSVAQIASSLVFVAGDDPVVVVTSGANRVSESKLATVVGVPGDAVTMADPETVKETTGWAIGGVPPFAHATTVPVYVDDTLLDHDVVWAAAGTPEAVFRIDPERLVALAEADPVDVAE